MKAFIEPLKEAGRVVVLAIIPVLIASLEVKQFDWISIGVVAGLALLRFIDKYLHDQAPDGVAGGLTRF
jgi:EamA domain-containing membrane protein RarD